MTALTDALGDDIHDVDQETFDLFSRRVAPHAPSGLGMLDPAATTLTVPIGPHLYTIAQSPGLLQADFGPGHGDGTTGAALWRCGVALAEWLAAGERNPLFATGALHADSTVLELGSGGAGLVARVLAARVRRVVASDQRAALRLLRRNLDDGEAAAATATTRAASGRVQRRGGRGEAARGTASSGRVEVVPLDWETDDAASVLRAHGVWAPRPDLVLGSDVVYNPALVGPLVRTCVEVCGGGGGAREGAPAAPTPCVIAQQLRDPEVFAQWLGAFLIAFRVWRVPDGWLTGSFKGEGQLVVHVGVLR